MCGRPLGLEIVNNRTLFFVDSYHGLFEHDLATNKQSLLFPKPDEKPKHSIKFLNSLQVDDQFIYFTHSSSIYQREEFTKSFLDADCTGRIVKLDRKSLEYTILASELCFPNGLSTDNVDKNFLLVNEIVTARTLRVNKVSGESTVFADGLPGFPDNLRSDGKFYGLQCKIFRIRTLSLISFQAKATGSGSRVLDSHSYRLSSTKDLSFGCW